MRGWIVTILIDVLRPSPVECQAVLKTKSSAVDRQAGVIEFALMLSAVLYRMLRCVEARPEVGTVLVEYINRAFYRY